MSRAECYTCLKAESECICATLPRVRCRTGVHVLQHPRERGHAIGTARIIKLGVVGARVEVVGRGLEASAGFQAGVPAGAALLYPHRAAEKLEELAPEDRPRDLVLLDGTWANARSLYRANPWLLKLRHVSLAPVEPSRYRIRKEPADHCLSTIEAFVGALRVLEPETVETRELIRAFDAMIDRQIAHTAGQPRQPRMRLRPPADPLASLPSVFREPARAVLVYSEIISTRLASGVHRESLSWVAERLVTGESFEVILKPAIGYPGEMMREKMGITSADLATGLDIDAALQAWRAFVRRDDVLVAWNHSTLAVGAPFVAAASECVELKRVYCNFKIASAGRLTNAHTARGHLEDLAAALELTRSIATFRGRGGQRMAAAAAIFWDLQARVPVHDELPPPMAKA